MPRCRCRDFQMAGFHRFSWNTSIPAQMIFDLVSYNASYCERKYYEMQIISNSQKIIQNLSLIFLFYFQGLNLIKKQVRNNRLKFLKN